MGNEDRRKHFAIEVPSAYRHEHYSFGILPSGKRMRIAGGSSCLANHKRVRKIVEKRRGSS
jgi:hypothetical protein